MAHIVLANGQIQQFQIMAAGPSLTAAAQAGGMVSLGQLAGELDNICAMEYQYYIMQWLNFITSYPKLNNQKPALNINVILLVVEAVSFLQANLSLFFNIEVFQIKFS